MLQKARVTAITVSELLSENQRGGEEVKLPPPTQIRVKEQIRKHTRNISVRERT